MSGILGGGWKRGQWWNCEPTPQPKGRGWKPSTYRCARQCPTRQNLAGDSLSLADLLYAPAIAYLPMVPEGAGFLEGKPNINRWFERVASRESFAKTNPFPPEQEAAE